jgi:hypothetical protein
MAALRLSHRMFTQLAATFGGFPRSALLAVGRELRESAVQRNTNDGRNWKENCGLVEGELLLYSGCSPKLRPGVSLKRPRALKA